MVEVQTYYLPPTGLMPNSPHVLIHYPGYLSSDKCTAADVYDLFLENDWEVQWIARYGATQGSHYHYVHECMAVLTGSAKILFGAGDIVEDGKEIGQESAGIVLTANKGDVFILPAGLAHKTHDPSPLMEMDFFAPEGDNPKQQLANVKLDGFRMIGAYPRGLKWNWANGGADIGCYSKLWDVPKPEKDPVLGTSKRGLVGLWQDNNVRPRL